MHDRILILDFGSQVTQLIARRIREAHVFCEIHPNDVSDAFIREFAPKGIILSGSHASTYEEHELRAPQAVFELGVPVLGICYGMFTMAGAARRAGRGERAPRVRLRRGEGARPHPAPGRSGGLLDDRGPRHAQGLDEPRRQGDRAAAGLLADGLDAELPDRRHGRRIARLLRGAVPSRGHPHGEGREILERFVLGICGARADWVMGNYIEEAVARIRDQVGEDEVILGLSGGVDSSVAAALIHKAIGDRLTCVFVDHGLLRLDEGRMVMEMFADRLHARVIAVDASEQFLGQLAGIADPEQKRKIIGREFVEVFTREAGRLKNAKWLAQGTIYPDVIESGGAKTKKAISIKSHHNVGGLPSTLGLKLLEPLRELFKDEVRELGVALGLPRTWSIAIRSPARPGVRILGEVKRESADLLRRADAIFIEELRNTVEPASGKTWYDLTSQAFAVFLPVKSVGVMGDGRTYENVVALRAVQTSDFMTADWAELPYALLKKVSSRIINEVRGINRVTYDVSSKPPATIEWE
jgi:GMP synthase (glutamine-hydrolysing)